MMFKTIRFKANLLYSGILCVILTSFSSFLFHASRQALYKNVEDELRVKAEEIHGIIDAYAEISASNASPVLLMRQFLSQHGEVSDGRAVIDELWEKDSRSLGLARDVFRILNLNGQLVLRSNNLTKEANDVFDRGLKGCRPGRACSAQIRLNGAPFYALSYPFMFSNRSSFVLQLATPLAAVEKTLARLLMFMVGGVCAILLTTAFIGAFLAKRILRPVIEVTRMAKNISQKNLSARIRGQAQDDEMGLLVESFNGMIGRLEQSFAHINEFSSQVAHELKTPLAIMKGELELALADPGLKEEEARVMGVALQEVDLLTRIVKDLLLLARFEYQSDVFNMERIELYGFLEDIRRRIQGLADEKGLTLELSVPPGDFFIKGDGVHLKRLFFNLAHNAVKFTPSGGVIRISSEIKDSRVCVHIADTGEGIAPEHHARVFEKFYRVRKSDDANRSGTGLGLALALSIAKAHGGEILLKSEWGKGSTFTVVLPV